MSVLGKYPPVKLQFKLNSFSGVSSYADKRLRLDSDPESNVSNSSSPPLTSQSY